MFNERGLITPPGITSMTVDEFEQVFVESFPDSSTRRSIFADYLQYVDQFSDQICSNFTHWVDGSFVTQKQNPRDLDFVVLIDASDYATKQALIDSRFRLRAAQKLFPKLDVYTVRRYSKSHPKYFITESDLTYWYNQFSKTTHNRAGKQFAKGFIEIVVNR